MKWSVEAPPFVDMAAEGAMGVNPESTEPMHLSSTAGIPRTIAWRSVMRRRAWCARSG